MKPRSRKTPAPRCSRQTRLAESSVASVDLCDCGAMQLHLGSITLRFTPAALQELLGVLGEATVEHARRNQQQMFSVGMAQRGSA